MGFLDKVVDVLGFVEREEYEEETPAEKAPQQTPKVTAIPVKSEPKPMPRINNVVSFTNPKQRICKPAAGRGQCTGCSG